MVVWLLMAMACPDEASVSRELSKMVSPAVLERHRWLVLVRGAELRMVLETADGVVVRERSVAAPGACAERAKVASTVLAAWMIEVPQAPDAGVRVVRERVQPAPREPAATERRVPEVDAGVSIVVVEASPRAVVFSPGREGERPVVELPSHEPVLAEASVTPPAEVEPEVVPWSAELGLDLRAQFSGSMTAAFAVRGGLGRDFGGFIELDAALPRVASWGAGTISWTRAGGGLGARWRAPWRAVLLEPAVSVELAALWVRGDGFRENASVLVFDAAGCAHLRVGVRWSAWLAFFGARACVWPIATSARVGGVEGVLPLPTFEFSVLGGLSYEWLQGARDSRL